MNEELLKYIPENAVELVEDIFINHPIQLKIVKNRKTKHGDFKRRPYTHLRNNNGGGRKYKGSLEVN